MIYTCTLNPSVDYILKNNNFKFGELNRVSDETYSPGGKGIVVSMVLNNLGEKSQLLGFIGGFTGEYIISELKQYPHLVLSFDHVLGNTRINVKLKADKETEINASGPSINDADYEALLEKISLIKKEDWFVLSGSVPPSLDKNVYYEIAMMINDQGATLIVDSNKTHLLSTLEFKPFLIKPNKHELEEIFKTTIQSDDEIEKYAKALMNQGAQNVLVSLGKDGSMLITKEGTFRCEPLEGKLIDSVGAGDSMVAGYVYEYRRTQNHLEALKTATACGSATAFSSGYAKKNDVMHLREKVKIKRIGVNK
jgi:1-phosphofructokinase